jgi:hypothetical protein
VALRHLQPVREAEGVEVMNIIDAIVGNPNCARTVISINTGTPRIRRRPRDHYGP